MFHEGDYVRCVEEFFGVLLLGAVYRVSKVDAALGVTLDNTLYWSPTHFVPWEPRVGDWMQHAESGLISLNAGDVLFGRCALFAGGWLPVLGRAPASAAPDTEFRVPPIPEAHRLVAAALPAYDPDAAFLADRLAAFKRDCPPLDEQGRPKQKEPADEPLPLMLTPSDMIGDRERLECDIRRYAGWWEGS